MSLSFPASPTNGQIYQGWVYSASSGGWVPNFAATLVATYNGRAGAVVPQTGDETTGQKVLISKTVISAAVTQVDLFTGFDGTYDELEDHLFDWQPATTDVGLTVRVSTDGSTFDTGSANYGYAWQRFGTDATASGAGSFSSAFGAGPSQSSNVNFGFYTIARWRLGVAGSPRASFVWQGQTHSTSLLLAGYGAGEYAVNVGIKGVRYYFNGFPNITRGTLIHYGIKK